MAITRVTIRGASSVRVSPSYPARLPISPAQLACPSRLPISPDQRGRADVVFAKRWSRHAGPASRLFLSIQLMAFSKSSTEFGAKKVLPRISSSLPRPGTHAHTHTHTHRRGGRRLRSLVRTSARGVRREEKQQRVTRVGRARGVSQGQGSCRFEGVARGGERPKAYSHGEMILHSGWKYPGTLMKQAHPRRPG